MPLRIIQFAQLLLLKNKKGALLFQLWKIVGFTVQY